MKEALQVNIAGSLFHIERDAYLRLRNYLNSMERYFARSSEGKEIMADIEGRINELSQSMIGANRLNIIILTMVQSIIDTLGRPEEIASVNSEKPNKMKSKRMYRDAENRLIGGVCSGLSAYFRIDKNIVRLVFLLSILVFGTGTLLYLLLWLIVPEARSTTEKLEMRGEPVNISSIEQTIKAEFERVKENMGF